MGGSMFQNEYEFLCRLGVTAAAVALSTLAPMCIAAPTVFPTGTTIYDPDKAWNGYTIHDTPADGGAVLVDSYNFV